MKAVPEKLVSKQHVFLTELRRLPLHFLIAVAQRISLCLSVQNFYDELNHG